MYVFGHATNLTRTLCMYRPMIGICIVYENVINRWLKYNTFYLFVSTLFMYYKHDQNMYVFGHATNVNN